MPSKKANRKHLRNRFRRATQVSRLVAPESLEGRAVLANAGLSAAVSAVITDGTLTITGTTYDDAIDVRLEDGMTIVRTATRHSGEFLSGSIHSPFTTFAFASGDYGALSINGGTGDDAVSVVSSLLTLSAPTAIVVGGSGDDYLEVEGIAAVVSGDAGYDTLATRDGAALLSYASSPSGVDVDLLSRSAARDGYGAQDVLNGFRRLEGSLFADTLRGSEHSDSIKGLDGSDLIDGEAGDDDLHGGADADVLSGGPGHDIINGGSGVDEVSFKRAASGGSVGVVVNLVAGWATGEGSDTLVAIEDAYGSPAADQFIFATGSRVVGAAGDDLFVKNGALLDTTAINPNAAGAIEDFVASAPEIIDLFTEFWDEFQDRYVAATAMLPDAQKTQLDQSLWKFFDEIRATPASDRFDNGLSLWGPFKNTPFDPDTYKSTYDESVEGVNNIVQDGTKFVTDVAAHWGDIATQFGTEVKTFVMAGTVTIAKAFINFGENIGDACVDFYTDLATSVTTPDPIVAMARFGSAFGVFVRDVTLAPVKVLFEVAVDLGFQFWAQTVGRPLNRAEQEVAKSVFGRSLDLDPIRVVSDSGWENLLSSLASLGGSAGPGAQTLGQSIFLPTSAPPERVYGWNQDWESLTGSANISLLVHELVHVWQKQQLKSVVSEALGEHISSSAAESPSGAFPNLLTTPWDKPPGDAYHVGMGPGLTWKALGIEAQAAAVENLFSFLEVTTSLERIQSVAKSRGFTLGDVLSMEFFRSPNPAMKTYSTVNPNSFPGSQYSVAILSDPYSYGDSYAGLPRTPESTFQPYQAWVDYFRVVYTEGGFFRGLFRQPWPGFLSRGDSWSQSLSTNVGNSLPPGKGFPVNAYPSLDGQTYTFVWKTPQAGDEGLDAVYLEYGPAGAASEDRRTIYASPMPGATQSVEWTPDAGEDYSDYVFRVWVQNKNGSVSSAEAEFSAFSLAGGAAPASSPMAVTPGAATTVSASRRPSGRGFAISVDTTLASVTFVGDQPGASGETRSDSLYLWEEGGALRHNLVGEGYQDAGDFDDGPGVLGLPATGVEVFVFAGAGNDFVDASGLRSATANIYGQAGDDVLLGADTNSGYGDRIFGGPGSDSVWGLGGDDELDGEDDDDVVDGGIGNDRIAGGLGDDLLVTGIGRDRVDGGAGIDRTRFVGVGGGILATSSNGRPVLMAAKDGSTVGLQGAAGIEAISIVGTDSVDVVMVLDTLPGVSLAIDAAGGDDRVLVGGFDPQGDAALQGDLARIVGSVVVSGGTGDDAIVFLDNATGVDRNYSIDPSGMQAVLPGRGGAAPVLVSGTSYGGVERVDLRGSNGRNRFDVIPGVDAGVAIDGGLPASGSVSAAEGDYLAIDTVSRFPVSNDGMDTSGRRLKITERGVGRWDFADTSAHKSVEFKSIERFNHVDRFAVGVGGGPGSRPSVRVFDAGTMTALFEIPASATYGNTFRNGVSVACGDMDNDGIPDVITAPGPGAKVVVKVFNGAPKVGVEGSEIVELRISEKDTFGKKYLGGANIAVGDVVGDGMRDIVVAPMRGRPVVKVYEGQLAAGSVSPTIFKVPVRTFNPFPGWHSYTGGASLTTARVDSSGRARIVVGSGAGMPTLIRDFDVRNAGVVIARTHVSVAPNCYGDVRVSAGDVDGDGVDDVLATVQAVGGTWMRARSGADGRTLLLSYQFTVTATTRPTQGILVDANADGKAEMFAALAGSGSAGPRVVRYRPLQGLSTDGKLHSIQISAPGRINLG